MFLFVIPAFTYLYTFVGLYLSVVTPIQAMFKVAAVDIGGEGENIELQNNYMFQWTWNIDYAK